MFGLLALFLGYRILGDAVSVVQRQEVWYHLLSSIVVHGAFGAVPLAFVWFYPVWLARNAPAVGVEREVTVSSKGMTLHSSLGKSDSAWANFTKMLETDEYFLLYSGKGLFYPFPKQAFGGEHEVRRFRELIRGQIRNSRILDSDAE
jgi:hypothetical protein